MAARVALHAAVERGAEGVVVVEGDEEEFVVVPVRRVEVDVEVVGVVPIVVPHTYHHIYGIGSEQQLHIAHRRNPVVEILPLTLRKVARELDELRLCRLEILGVALKLVGVVGTRIVVEVDRGAVDVVIV